MPLSPITGFLVITHLLINAVVLVYELFLRLVHTIRGERPVHTFMHWWFKREHDSPFRRFVAYGLSTLVLGIVIGTTGLSLWRSNSFFSGLAMRASLAKVALTTEAYSNMIGNQIDIERIEGVDPYLFRVAVDSHPESLVDSLRASGLNDPTFDYRAGIAVELGIVTERSQYRGTYEQNIAIRRKLIEKVSGQILSKNSVNN